MNLKWKAELLFWAATIVLTILFIAPLVLYYGEKFPFYAYNIGSILIFLVFTRYIFLLKHTPFSYNKTVKLILLFACIPLFLYFIDGIYEFQRFVDEGKMVGISGTDMEEAATTSKYTRYQFIFFGVSALIVMVLLPIRMVVSIWRVTNDKGSV